MHCVGAGKFCVWPLLRKLGGVKLTKYCLFQRCLNFESIKCPRGRNEEKKPIHITYFCNLEFKLIQNATLVKNGV